MSAERESVPVGVTIPRRLLERVDAYRDETGVTRSSIVVAAVSEYLQQREAVQKALAVLTDRLPEMISQVASIESTKSSDAAELMVSKAMALALEASERSTDVEN